MASSATHVRLPRPRPPNEPQNTQMKPISLLSARRSGREFGYDVVRAPPCPLVDLVLVFGPSRIRRGRGNPRETTFGAFEPWKLSPAVEDWSVNRGALNSVSLRGDENAGLG
jgi:hypothetical protein